MPLGGEKVSTSWLVVLGSTLALIVGNGPIKRRVVSTWFDQQRGLALGVTLGRYRHRCHADAEIHPLLRRRIRLASRLFRAWRGIALVAFPAVALFVRDRPRRARVESVLAEA